MKPKKQDSKEPGKREDDVIEPPGPGPQEPDVIEPPFEKKKALAPKEIK
jgi:hypothetical protein